MSEYDWNLVASALSDDRIFFDVPLGPALANTIPNAGWSRSSSTIMS